MNAIKFNQLYKVGKKVRYYPIAGEDECEETVLRSEAWTLFSGYSIVKVDGRTGGVSLEHICTCYAHEWGWHAISCPMYDETQVLCIRSDNHTPPPD